MSLNFIGNPPDYDVSLEFVNAPVSYVGKKSNFGLIHSYIDISWPDTDIAQ